MNLSARPIALAATLLLGGTAFAQNQDSTPPPSDNSPSAMQSAPPSSDNSTSGSSTATDSSATATSVAKACKKQAADKKLTGDDKEKYIKDCKAGKTTREGR